MTGVHADVGLTTDDADEAAMKRLLARRAADTYALAGVEKIGAASRSQVLPLGDIAGVVTDAAADEPTVRQLAERGVPIIRADGRP